MLFSFPSLNHRFRLGAALGLCLNGSSPLFFIPSLVHPSSHLLVPAPEPAAHPP
jgi:hypothetical protein